MEMNLSQGLPLPNRGPRAFAVRASEFVPNCAAEGLRGTLRKDIPALGVWPRLANFSCQRLLAASDHFR